MNYKEDFFENTKIFKKEITLNEENNKYILNNFIDLVQKENLIEKNLENFLLLKIELLNLYNNKELINNIDFLCEFLINLIFPEQKEIIIYHSINLLIILSCFPNFNNFNFLNFEFFKFLFKLSIKNLSGRFNFYSNDLGISSLTLIKNLLIDSNEIFNFLIQLNCIEILISLYQEIIETKIQNLILIILKTSLNYNLQKKNIIKIFQFLIPFFELNLSDINFLMISILFQICKLSEEYSLFFLNNFNIQNIFYYYSTARNDVRPIILKLFNFLLLFKNEIILNKSSMINWNSINKVIELFGTENEKKVFLNLILTFFKINSDEIFNIYETNIFNLLMNFLDKDNFEIKYSDLKTIYLLFEINNSTLIDILANYKLIPRLYNFLELEYSNLVEWSLKILISIIDYAKNTIKIDRIIQEFEEIDILSFEILNIHNDYIYILKNQFIENINDLFNFYYNEFKLINNLNQNNLINNNQYEYEFYDEEEDKIEILNNKFINHLLFEEDIFEDIIN